LHGGFNRVIELREFRIKDIAEFGDRFDPLVAPEFQKNVSRLSVNEVVSNAGALTLLTPAALLDCVDPQNK